METVTTDMNKIVVDTKYGVRGFVGRWIVDPDSDDRVELHDAGGSAVYGVAVTAKRQYVVWAAPAGLPREFEVYPSLRAASDDGIPPSVIDAAEQAMQPDKVVWLDI